MKKLLIVLLLLSQSLHAAFSADIPGGSIQFPTIPNIPVPEGIGYDNFFNKNQPVKLVFGISDPGAQFEESLTNAAYTINYLKPRGIKYEIELVLYGKAVLPANTFNEEYAGYNELMETLNQQGVEFTVCNNSLAALNQSADEIYPYMKIIPAGILEIAKNQMQGFAYLNNTR